jgi:hypothetical protein
LTCNWGATLIKKTSLFWFFSLLFFALVIANRPNDLDPDYTVYQDNFFTIVSGGEVSVELGYRVFSLLSDALGFGFVGVLFIYAFIALYYKFMFVRSLDGLTIKDVFFFLVIYCIVFFPLWEITQIRNAAAVAVSCYAVTRDKKVTSFFLFFIAALLHNVAVIVLIMWLIYKFFYSVRFLIVCGGAVLLYFIIDLMPYFSSYSADVYKQVFDPLSLKNLFIIITILFVSLHKQPSASMFGFFAFAFLGLYLSMGQMPAAALRIVDIALFFSVVSLMLIHGRFTMLYKFLTVGALGYVYIKIAFFADPPLLNFQSMLG